MSHLTIYKASAGSGKTYTLTLQYITLLLGVKDADGVYYLNHKECLPQGEGVQHHRHRHILAVTFTNKATEEMKQRIIKELQDLAKEPAPGKKDAAYAAALMELFGCTRRQLAEAANDAMREIIFDYSRFHVSTIDAFFQNVLRSMAFEFERQGDYDITMDSDAVINFAIDELLEEFNAADERQRKTELGPLNEWIRRKMGEAVSKGEDFNVFQAKGSVRRGIVEFVHSFFDEGFAEYGKAMSGWLNRDGAIQAFRQAVEDKIKSLKAELAALMEAARDAVAGRKLKAFASKILENNPTPNPKTKFYEAAVKASFEKEPFGTDDIFSKNTPTPAEAQTILAALNSYARYLADIKSLEAVNKYVGMYGLQKLVLDRVEQWRRDNNILLLSDAADLISKFVTQDDVPFMYERMGVNLRHFLIDEFQDTSRLQWKNFRPLLSNSLASGFDNLIIGDEKQSIYRFRNSDSSLLQHEVADEFPDDYQLKGVNPGENTNHRSAVEIVRFNNTLFHYIVEHMKLSDGEHFDSFDNVIQDIPERHRDLHGVVRIHIPPQKDKDAEKNADADTEAETANAAEEESVEAAMIKSIRRQHDECGYRWGDIAVLTDTNRQASGCVTALINAGIPVMSADALEIDRARSVALVIGIIRLIANLWNITNEAMAKGQKARRVRASMMLCRFELALYREGTNDGAGADADTIVKTIEDVVDDLANDRLGDDFRKQLEHIVSLHPSTLMSLADMIVATFVPKSMAQREMVYLSALSDTLMDYSNLYGNDIYEFLNWWDRQTKHPTVKASGDTDAVNVVTIHSAKGLQYPCVHLPYMDFKLVDGKKVESEWVVSNPLKKLLPDDVLPPAVFIRYDSGMESYNTSFRDAYLANCRAKAVDSINKAYVALTRPERELDIYVSSESSQALTRDEDTGTVTAADLAPNNPFDVTLVSAVAAVKSGTPMPAGYEDRDPAVTEALAEHFDSNTEYVYGADTHPDYGKNVEDDTAEDLDYGTYIRDDTAIVTRVDAITRIDDGEEGFDDEDDEPAPPEAHVLVDGIYESEEVRQAAIRGKVLHEVLSGIRRPEDVDDDEVMTPLCRCAAAHYLRHTHDYKIFLDDLRALFGDDGTNDAGLRRWFVETDDSMDEQPIFVPPLHPEDDDDIGRLLRPDRVVIHEGVMEVVDFKFTTREYPAHHRQVGEYCRILHQIYPEYPIKGYLWYLDRHTVVPVKLD